jgi:hypothetical protein
MSVSKISLHVEARNVLRPSKICVSQRSKPDEFQIWIASGQTLRLNFSACPRGFTSTATDFKVLCRVTYDYEFTKNCLPVSQQEIIQY